MKWFGFGRKDAPQIEKKGASVVGIPANSFLEYALGGGGSYLNARQAMAFYQQSSSVASSVDRIADACRSITPVLEGPDGKFTDSAEVLDFLKRPNAFETREQFITAAAIHYLVTGDSHVSLLGNTKYTPTEAYTIKPYDVTPMEDGQSRYATSYLVVNGEGRGNYRREPGKWARYIDSGVREFAHIRSFSSRSSNVWSDSPLMAAALEARQQIQARTHNLALLRNGARMSLVAVFKDDPDEDEMRTRLEVLKETFAGASNAGKIGGTRASDVDFQEFGQTNKDMDFATLDEIASRAIYVRYKIPLPLISNDAATYNNMESAVYHLYDNAVLPTFDAVMSGIGNVLLPRFKLDPLKYRITYDAEQITALRGRMLQELKARKELGIETINEMRAQLPGREPIDGGDTLYQPAALVPVGTDLYTSDNTSETPEQEAARLMRNEDVNE